MEVWCREGGFVKLCVSVVKEIVRGSGLCVVFFFFQAEDGIRDHCVTGVQTCALPIYMQSWGSYSINDVSAILPVMYGAGALDNYSRNPELEKLIAEGGATSDKAARTDRKSVV